MATSKPQEKTTVMNYLKPWLKKEDDTKELTFAEEQELIMQQNLEAYENSYGWQLHEERKIKRVRQEKGLKRVHEYHYRSAEDIARRKERDKQRKQKAKEERELKRAFLATAEGKEWQKQKHRNTAIEKRMAKKVQKEFYIAKQIQYINECRQFHQPIQFYKTFGHGPAEEVRVETNFWAHKDDKVKSDLYSYQKELNYRSEFKILFFLYL